MVKITAFLPPKHTRTLLQNLDRIPVTGYTLIEGNTELSKADDWSCVGVASTGNDVFETVVPDEAAAEIVAFIRELADLEEETNRIVVSPVSDAIRIRTEERGESAIR